ncbi:MAG: heat-inducible transcription repressor HrcA [Alteromonadaceae bacterium]|nr:heat-inducible transcription repressor HrcA [Alteromonadaceae bacterium]RCL47732.1 MAG: heat-inducible transcription repressor HrcA [Halieaceae bacterium]RPH12664.1 MAG: heat-inducible transcription repressor HrcA [Alteromonadaceae bacterium TMED101]|tara:strand:+ start:1562 stop:2596 length:1035 start_codon:yes stop_codon:yes gene_type:complete
MSTEGLTPRAASLLRTLVGMHIREGQPVGSKALHVESGMSVSTATIRNVMSDLEERGLLSSPHTSAGRIPTAQGYRLFVDSLLQTSPIDASALQALKHELNPNRTSSDLIASASNLLTQVTAQAGIVTVPRPTASQLRQIEFLPLSDSRVLVILVVNEREVQNRVIELSRPLSEEQLKVAADLINQRYAGNNLSEVKRMLVAEMADARTRIDEQLEAALQVAKDAMEPEDAQEEYVVAGESRLIQQAGANDMDKLRELFDAFERKRDLVELLDRCSRADGIQIFIGEEAGYEVLGDYSVITAPYAQGTQPVGVLGVIGPTRMAYDRVIPLVDITARLLTAALSR